MKNLKKILFITTMTLLVYSCNTETKKQEKENQTEQKVAENVNFEGNYVNNSYSQRKEGYDWVAVIVSKESDNQLKIVVRSRADKKKPTCTFDIIAQKFDKNTYTSVVQDKKVMFRFSENGITIETEKKEDSSILSFYCSGGASIADTYTKINEPLDETQIDKTKFSKVLNLQDVGFNISSTEKNGATQLSIFTFGLPNDFKETLNINNQIVVNAEVDDLDADGSPELVVFTKDSSNKENVYAYSVNNKKSMSSVYFQPTVENNKINIGYNGQDRFTLMEGNLVQRFPVFENNVETKKIRQVAYKLKDGESSKKFEISKHTDYEK